MEPVSQCSKLYVPFERITPAEVCRLSDCVVDGDEHAVIIQISGENWQDSHLASKFKPMAVSLQRQPL
jgi:hypothetical protein